MDVLHNNVGTILEMTKTLSPGAQDYISKLFQDAPLWLFDNISIMNLEKNKVFILENTPVNKVYFLVEGSVKAVENRIYGKEYDYMHFTPVKIFGSMEILLDIMEYKTSLVSVTPCIFLVMQQDRFREWIQKDINALLMETKSMGSYLLEQSRKERNFLFLSGKDRLFLVFMDLYEYQIMEQKRCIINMTRQELSDCSGLSVKTINRAVKKMEEEGFIGRSGSKILISSEQFMKMQDYIKNLISVE